MLSDNVDEFRKLLVDRFTPEELLEILGVSTGELIEKFYDEVLDVDWSEFL